VYEDGLFANITSGPVWPSMPELLGARDGVSTEKRWLFDTV